MLTDPFREHALGGLHSIRLHPCNYNRYGEDLCRDGQRKCLHLYAVYDTGHKSSKPKEKSGIHFAKKNHFEEIGSM